MALAVLTAYVRVNLIVLGIAGRLATSVDNRTRRQLTRSRLTGDRGQATTEYALVLLAAALVGLLVVAWATAGGGAERVARLFNKVIDGAIDRV